MRKSNKILAVVMALVMIITAVPMMTAMAGDEHEHVYSQYGDTVEPKCEDVGYTVYKCSCGDTKTVYTEALGHKLEGSYSKSALGHTKYCDRCKIQAFEEHKFADVKVTKEATCTETGTKTVKCSVCGYETTQIIAAKGHNVTTVAANDIAALTHKGVCTVCETTVTVAHVWGEGVVTKAPKCTTAGEMTYTCTVCKKETKVNTETAMEDLVGVAVTAEDWVKIMPTHSYGSWKSANDDEHKRECVCGDSEPAAHDFVVVVGEKSLCDNSVALTITCKDCDYKLETKATEHEFKDIEKYNDTKHKQVCNKCGLTETAEHTWVDVKVDKAATCKEAGSKTVKCACGETKTVEIPKTEEHTWGEAVETKKADCGNKGVKTYTCTVCAATKTEETPVVGEHKYGAWEVDYPATPISKGQKSRVCEVCGNKESEKFEYKAEEEEILLGDVSGDGKIGATDARLVLQYVAGLKDLTEDELKRADINEKDGVTAVDARIILQEVAGLR